MFALLSRLLVAVRSRMRSQARLKAENLMLHQQVLILSRRSPTGVWLRNLDRLGLVWLYRSFPSILNAITGVAPETVVPVAPPRLPNLLALEVSTARWATKD